MQVHLTKPKPGKEGNRKLGRMPSAYIARESCPTSCPLQGNGCYAEGGPVRIHWDLVSLGRVGMAWARFCAQVALLTLGQIWRYGVAGDLPGHGDEIDRDALNLLTLSNMRRPVIAYTHKPVLAGDHALSNRRAIAEAIEDGFNINLSGDSLRDADELADLHLAPVVAVLSNAYARRHTALGRGKKEWAETIGEYRERVSTLPTHTPAGRRIAVCPATYADTTCVQCRVCTAPRAGGAIIGFPAHGGAKAKAEALALSA